MTVKDLHTPSQPRGVPGLNSISKVIGVGEVDAHYQKVAPFVFNVPFEEVDDHALVYGDLTARGIAGGRAGE